MFPRYFWRLVYRDSGHASIYRRGYTLRCICRKRESPLLCKHSSVYAVDRTARQLGNNNQVRGPSTSGKRPRPRYGNVHWLYFVFPPFCHGAASDEEMSIDFRTQPSRTRTRLCWPTSSPDELLFIPFTITNVCYPLTFFLYTIFLRYCLYFPAEISLAFNYTTFNLSTFYFSTYVFQVLHIYLAPSSF